MNKEELAEVKSRFAADRYAVETTGIQILDAGDGLAEVMLELDNRHKNALGAVMGAVYFTMADFAFAVATNSCPQDKTATVTLNSQINYLNAAKSNTLYAKAVVKKNGRTTVYCEIEIYEKANDTKRTVAVVSTTGFKISK